MLWQWILVTLMGLAAAGYLARLILRSFRNKGCAGCTSAPRTRRALKRLMKENQKTG